MDLANKTGGLVIGSGSMSEPLDGLPTAAIIYPCKTLMRRYPKPNEAYYTLYFKNREAFAYFRDILTHL